MLHIPISTLLLVGRVCLERMSYMADMEQAKAFFELQSLQTIIKQELDIDGQVLNRSAEIPVDTLAVTLDTDGEGRMRIASLIFVPLAESDIEALKLLQFYCETPVHVEPQAVTKVAQFLSAVNLKNLIGTFSLDAEHVVTYRYVYSLGKFATINQEEFLETFMLWMFGLDSLTPMIEAVATGALSLDDAVAALEE